MQEARGYMSVAICHLSGAGEGSNRALSPISCFFYVDESHPLDQLYNIGPCTPTNLPCESNAVRCLQPVEWELPRHD